MDRLTPSRKTLRMNAGIMDYKGEPLYGDNGELNKRYCRQWQPNHLCAYGLSCRYVHEQDSDYKGPVNVDDFKGVCIIT